MKSIFLILLFLPSVLTAQVRQIDYEGFSIWLDCQKRGLVAFSYSLGKDKSNIPRKHQFFFDEDVPPSCQQTSTKTYRHPTEKYDRGHLVPANHMDFSEIAIKQSNYMTNVLPQTRTMNRGAWLKTETIIDCKRDEIDLQVIGGVLWGNDESDDFFLGSHGVRTPDAFWKVVILKDNEDIIAWIVPNTNDATSKKLDEYIVSVKEIEEKAGVNLDVPPELKMKKPDKSWIVPKDCDRS